VLAREAAAQTEYETKAKNILIFAQFTTWREDDFAGSNAPLVIGILGKNPFAKKDIEMMKSALIQKRKVEVRLFTKVEEVSDCHVLFISSSEKSRLRETLKPLKNRRLLTISDVEGFIEEGGDVSIVGKRTGIDTFDIIRDISSEVLASRRLEFRPEFVLAIKKSKT
jgi:hypothetical protein